MAEWIEVVYARPERQRIVRLAFVAGMTAGEAVRASRLGEEFPELATRAPAIGVWGEVAAQDRRLRPGDRVELYRELLIDPRDNRRRRAQEQAARPGHRSAR